MEAASASTIARPELRGTLPAVRWRAVGGALALALLLTGVLLIVLVASARWTFLVPPGQHAFPRWMAGPLHGLFTAFHPTRAALKVEFTAAVGALYLAYLLALATVPALRARWLIGAIVALHVVLFLSPPLSLTDVFNYLDYGRMGALHGLNPYTHIPVSEPHTDPAFLLSNWHHLRSPYGPLFTLLTYALVPLGVATAFWTWKALLLLAGLGLVAAVWRCAQILGRDPRLPAAIVGLNPLVLVWGLGGDHLDALMVFVLAVGLLAVLSGRELLGGAAAAVAVALKASAALVAPVLLLGARRKRPALGSAAAAGAVLAAASLVAFGPHLPNVADQSKLVAAVSLPNLLGLALGQGGQTDTLRLVLDGCMVAVTVLASIGAWRGRDLATMMGIAAFSSLILVAWTMPWYVLLVLPFAALGRSRALLAATLVIGVWLILSWVPVMPDLVHGIGFYPSRTPLGHEHNAFIRQLLH